MEFSFYETINKPLPLSIRINSNQANNINEAIFIRLLSGTINFQNNSLNSQNILQRTNYFLFTYRKNKKVSIKILKDINPLLVSNQIDKYFQLSKNKNFFNELKLELACFFYFKSQESHTTAFLHLYRLLEHISFSFPLLYSSISNDFISSFDSLKNLFKENSNGNELNFHRIFFNQLFVISDPIIPYNNDIELDFSFLTTNEFNKIRMTFLNVVRGESRIKTTDLNIDVNTKKVTFKFNLMHSFIIIFRNRFFHYNMSHPNNISSQYFISEIFFKVFNEYSLNWIAYIFGEILDYRLNNTNFN